jgi:hypothetical protein
MSKPPSKTRLAAARTVPALTVVLVLIAVSALSPTRAHATLPTPSARAAHTLNATDTAHLRYIRSSGSLLYEEGAASGTLPGTMRAHCNVGAILTASFTIYTHDGTITGHGSATPHGSGTYESFSGSLVVSSGTGRYAHARGHAGLYGTFDRRTYDLVVQTTGQLSY